MVSGISASGIAIFHWCIQIEIFDVSGRKLGLLSGDDAVEHDFCCGKLCCLCADITGVVNAITTDCESNSFCSFFLGLVCCNNLQIGWFSSIWNFVAVDKEHCVGSFDGCVTVSLC